MRIWVVDFGNGVERAFTSLERAYQVAYDQLIDWDYSPEDDWDTKVFDELKRTYENKNCSGFYVDELLWCWEVEVN